MPSVVERYLSNLPVLAALRAAPWGTSARRITATALAVGTDEVDVWEGGSALVYPGVAAPLEVVSSSPADDTNGVGARTILIEGLDADYSIQTESLPLMGLTPVAAARTYLRVLGIRVLAAGLGGQAAGTITLQLAGGGDVQALVTPESFGISLASHFTIPAGKTAYVLGARYSSDDQTTRFAMVVRRPGEAFAAIDYFQVGVAASSPSFLVPLEVPEKSDLKIVARRPTAQTALALVSYDLLILPKTLAAIRSFGQPAV